MRDCELPVSNGGIHNSTEMNTFEGYFRGAQKMMENVVATVDGYVIPEYREGMYNVAVDKDENIIMECFELPMDFIKIVSSNVNQYISKRSFVVEVFGTPIGFSRVEFPTLDASDVENKVSLVKLYRAKMEVK